MFFYFHYSTFYLLEIELHIVFFIFFYKVIVFSFDLLRIDLKKTFHVFFFMKLSQSYIQSH
jgi:hypothetical protein